MVCPTCHDEGMVDDETGRSPSACPDCPRNNMIRIEIAEPRRWGIPLIRDVETGDDLLVQVDLDYPGFASTFGWQPECLCGGSDGTIDCEACDAKASDMIASAYNFLLENEGLEVEDPGYFTKER